MTNVWAFDLLRNLPPKMSKGFILFSIIHMANTFEHYLMLWLGQSTVIILQSVFRKFLFFNAI